MALKRVWLTGFVVVALVGPLPANAQSDEAKRVSDATMVMEEIMAAPDGGIPKPILDRAEAIAIFPATIKAGFVFGGHRGRGVILVKDPDTRAWSPPAFLTLTGGSFGLQIGGQSVDLILVIMNRRGVENLLRNEFKVGGDASAVVGPVGRDIEASTDIELRAEILSYSRTRGLFAGVTLKGSTIRADRDANERFYGTRLDSADIVLGDKAEEPADPAAVAGLTESLERHVSQ